VTLCDAEQAAKSVGQTLRAFQPTIKEVVEVSQEIKGTLEQVRQPCGLSGLAFFSWEWTKLPGRLALCLT
jgi:hypothetical protein